MTEKAKVKTWLDITYNNLGLQLVGKQKESELKERFIRFYCVFDKRLKRLRREKISVSPIKDGKVRLTLVAWGKCYGQYYKVN